MITTIHIPAQALVFRVTKDSQQAWEDYTKIGKWVCFARDIKLGADTTHITESTSPLDVWEAGDSEATFFYRTEVQARRAAEIANRLTLKNVEEYIATRNASRR
jgi:hypothetical protein